MRHFRFRLRSWILRVWFVTNANPLRWWFLGDEVQRNLSRSRMSIRHGGGNTGEKYKVIVRTQKWNAVSFFLRRSSMFLKVIAAPRGSKPGLLRPANAPTRLASLRHVLFWWTLFKTLTSVITYLLLYCLFSIHVPINLAEYQVVVAYFGCGFMSDCSYFSTFDYCIPWSRTMT